MPKVYVSRLAIDIRIRFSVRIVSSFPDANRDHLMFPCLPSFRSQRTENSKTNSAR